MLFALQQAIFLQDRFVYHSRGDTRAGRQRSSVLRLHIFQTTISQSSIAYRGHGMN